MAEENSEEISKAERSLEKLDLSENDAEKPHIQTERGDAQLSLRRIDITGGRVRAEDHIKEAFRRGENQIYAHHAETVEYEEEKAGDDWRDGSVRFTKYKTLVNTIPLMRTRGKVRSVTRVLVVSEGPQCNKGDLCYIQVPGREELEAEVVGFDEGLVYLAPVGSTDGISQGTPVYSIGKPMGVICSDQMLGRVLNGVGKPIDGKRLNYFDAPTPVMNEPFDPLKRKRITEPLQTGIKSIDSVLSVGKGQRLAIFSGSGVGKSTTLSMIARNTTADVNVIALIGERRREVLDFIERDLGEEGLRKSVLVVATSDESALVRLRGAFVATTIAEYFRNQGKDVMLMVDSLTRLAQAQRQIGLSMNEPPTTRGYPPSVFEILPVLLERSGTSDKGSITAFYNVLVEGDDMDEPITDAVRGILDGHIVLERKLAERGHYPAINVNASISRLMPEITSEMHQNAAQRLKQLYSSYKDMEDLILMGAYQHGSSPEVDAAINMKPAFDEFLKQGIFEESSFEESKRRLLSFFYSEAEINEAMGSAGLGEMEYAGVQGGADETGDEDIIL